MDLSDSPTRTLWTVEQNVWYATGTTKIESGCILCQPVRYCKWCISLHLLMAGGGVFAQFLIALLITLSNINKTGSCFICESWAASNYAENVSFLYQGNQSVTLHRNVDFFCNKMQLINLKQHESSCWRVIGTEWKGKLNWKSKDKIIFLSYVLTCFKNPSSFLEYSSWMLLYLLLIISLSLFSCSLSIIFDQVNCA